MHRGNNISLYYTFFLGRQVILSLVVLRGFGARRLGLAVASCALALRRHPELLARVDEGAAHAVQLGQLRGRRVEASGHRRKRVALAHLRITKMIVALVIGFVWGWYHLDEVKVEMRGSWRYYRVEEGIWKEYDYIDWWTWLT